MSFASIADLKAAVVISMGSLGSSTADATISQGCEIAYNELGFDYPVTDYAEEKWLIERGRRHSLMILCVEASSKFQFKKIYLQHRFKNYMDLITMLDKTFEKAVENDPVLFSDMSGYGSDGSYFINGMQFITSGFQYDQFGKDITYTEDSEWA